MKLTDKLGFIGGGQMAEALIQGIVQDGLVAAEQIMVTEPNQTRREFLTDKYNVRVAEDSVSLWLECNIVLLAVKPQIVTALLQEVKSFVAEKHLIISIAAGISLSMLGKPLAGCGCRIIRVMPNTPALVQEGASVLSCGRGVTKEDLHIATQVFNAVGVTMTLDESLLDAVTGLSGSGPAYVFSFIDAMIDAGVKTGLSRSVAETLVLQTILGSVKLEMVTNKHPAQLRSMVTSPGGTTIAGLHELERAGFKGIIMDAVEAAVARCRELGRKNLD